jgi:O-antigen biosynthesis protein WbqP
MLYQRVFKRLFDLAITIPALLLLSPLMLLTALAIRLDDGSPVLFRQERVGRDNRSFIIFKFRSMPSATPSVPSAAAGQLKVTRVGAFIRRTNIDELPQLLNVLRGEMSIVGPRPALQAQHELVAMRRERGVDRLRPGLTGLAQVNSFDGMTDAQKVEWERRYAGRVSFLTDLGIVARTFVYLLKPPPVY